MMTFAQKAQARAIAKGNTQKMKIGRRDYQGRTLDEVRQDVLTRALETRNIVAAWDGEDLEAPMAWTGRNCVVLKVGYGATNIGLVTVNPDFADDDAKRFEYYANGATWQERQQDALEELDCYIEGIKAGELDEAMEALIASYKTRAAKRTTSKKPNLKVAA